MPEEESPRKLRLCLRCRKYFDSEGPGNRICSRCNRSTRSASVRQRRMDLDAQAIDNLEAEGRR